MLLVSPLREIKSKSPLPIVAKVNEPNLKININILATIVDKNLLVVIKELENIIYKSCDNKLNTRLYPHLIMDFVNLSLTSCPKRLRISFSSRRSIN